MSAEFIIFSSGPSYAIKISYKKVCHIHGPTCQTQAYKQITNEYINVLAPGFQVSVCLSSSGTLNASFQESAL